MSTYKVEIEFKDDYKRSTYLCKDDMIYSVSKNDMDFNIQNSKFIVLPLIKGGVTSYIETDIIINLQINEVSDN